MKKIVVSDIVLLQVTSVNRKKHFSNYGILSELNDMLKHLKAYCRGSLYQTVRYTMAIWRLEMVTSSCNGIIVT